MHRKAEEERDVEHRATTTTRRGARQAPQAVTGDFGRRTLAVNERDRDAAGRAHNARPRDATGRPLPRGAAGVARVPEDLRLDPAVALAEAERLLGAGQPFAAHEVLEGVWKAERDAASPTAQTWQGLAQLAVGLTHLQRGNRRGAAALLRRGADNLDPTASFVPVSRLRSWATAVAAAVEADGSDLERALRLRPSLCG